MITRIGAAALALIWVHGWEESRESVEQAKSALAGQVATQATPGTAIRFCLENRALCEGTIATASTNLMARAEAPMPEAKQPSAEAMQPLPVATFPLPPRRPQR